MRPQGFGRSVSLEDDLFDVLNQHLPSGDAEDMTDWVESKDGGKLIEQLIKTIEEHVKAVTE